MNPMMNLSIWRKSLLLAFCSLVIVIGEAGESLDQGQNAASSKAVFAEPQSVQWLNLLSADLSEDER